MPLPRESRQVTRKRPRWTRALRITVAISLLVGLTANSPSQAPAPPPSKAKSKATRAEPPAASAETTPAEAPVAPPTEPIDPLGRETPRSAMMGLLKYGTQQDLTTAARYLQPTPGQDIDLTQRIRELQALRSHFESNIALLSDDPNGEVEAGLPLGEVRGGVVKVGGTTTDVILVRVDDPASGKIWLISKETVAKIPELYAQMESEAPTSADQVLPAAVTRRQLLGMSQAQWLGWLLSIPISWLLAWLSTFLLSAPRRVFYKLRKLPFRTVWQTPLGMPLRWILAIVMHSLFVYQLRLPILYRAYYFRFMAGLLVGCISWFVSRLADQGFNHALNRVRTQRRGGESVLIVMQRLNRVVMLIIAVVAELAIFGFNVKTTLAGLGIGGLAIALAAQKTLENLIGGVSLLMDEAVSVGDFCQIGDQVGTVEDIGLRSLKLRTLDQNLSVVPNGSLAQMQFLNMAHRNKFLINQTYSLRIETQAEQLLFVLDGAQSMLDQHPAVEPGTCRVRVLSLVGAAFELELFAYIKTDDWTQFTLIRQDVILKMAEIVEASGTRFAAPTRLNYHSSDAGIDTNKANATARPFVAPSSETTRRAHPTMGE
jgi:MscS family membrane protein